LSTQIPWIPTAHSQPDFDVDTITRILSGRQANLTALDKPRRLLWYKHPYIT